MRLKEYKKQWNFKNVPRQKNREWVTWKKVVNHINKVMKGTKEWKEWVVEKFRHKKLREKKND